MLEPHPKSPDVSPYTGEVWEWGPYSTVRQPLTAEERRENAEKLETLLTGDQMVLVDTLEPGTSVNEIWTTWGPAPNAGFLIRRDGIVDTAMLWVDLPFFRYSIDCLVADE